MKKIKNRRLNLLLPFIALAVAVSLGWLIYSQGFQQSSMIQYESEDLKMSFDYPKGWYVDKKDLSILIASYETRIGQNSQPNASQIKISIDRFSGCHPTIEENLKDPACGEGGSQVKPNEIIFKENRQLSDAIFYEYIVKSPSSNQFTFYLLEKGNRVLQISKKPDPSRYEKEFEEIVSSIRFQ